MLYELDITSLLVMQSNNAQWNINFNSEKIK